MKATFDFSDLKKVIDKLVESIKEEPYEWKLTIRRLYNGYELTGVFGDSDQESKIVIEDDDTDELKSHEQLLFEVMDYFDFSGSKHDPERIFVIRKKQK